MSKIGDKFQQKEKAGALRRLKETDVEALIKKGPKMPFVKRTNSLGEEGEDEDEDENGGGCCPFHSWRPFNAWKNSDVQSVYESCCNYTQRKIFEVPLLVLNQELVINESNIKIVGDKMFFLKGSNGKSLPRINFASCWDCLETPCGPDFISVDQQISAPQFLIPPIMFHKFDQGYHLVLDFFRNDWMVQVDDEHTIPVPIISNEVTAGETSFLSSLPRYSARFSPPFRIFEDIDDSDKEQEKEGDELGFDWFGFFEFRS